MPSHGAIVIAIDLSGSMSSVLNQAKDFIYDFVKKFSSDAVSIGMVGFAFSGKENL
ncbi:VWA domain-containing protein [Ruminococcus sp.]|uniref:VWA domain-containing protein n=1 Tax=Ruminococcus sp. TaxID=41978 RepID=UPI00300F72C2